MHDPLTHDTSRSEARSQSAIVYAREYRLSAANGCRNACPTASPTEGIFRADG